MVQAPGIEPGRLAAADFKSAAATYYATLACGAGYRIRTHHLRTTKPLLYQMS
jgi:hypothetical protein